MELGPVLLELQCDRLELLLGWGIVVHARQFGQLRPKCQLFLGEVRKVVHVVCAIKSQADIEVRGSVYESMHMQND